MLCDGSMRIFESRGTFCSSHSEATRRLSGCRKTLRYATAHTAVVTPTIAVATQPATRPRVVRIKSALSAPAAMASGGASGTAYRMKGAIVAVLPAEIQETIGNEPAK